MMASAESQIRHIKNAAYDHVGKYQQDKVNGLDDRLLDKFISFADIKGNEHILDAMAGNGNLSKRIFDYCRKHGLSSPTIKTLEYSNVQVGFAKELLRGCPAHVIWGDVLSMTDLSTYTSLENDSFDIVFIKSANHEIPLKQQEELYKSIFRVLKPGGKYLNLGFLFDRSIERDEFREIARIKDRLANMKQASANRHFLTQDEFYEGLRKAGFISISCCHKFNYAIRSSVVAKQYGGNGKTKTFNIEHQMAQIKAFNMRKKGLINFEGDDSIMRCPGELTIAYKPHIY